MLKDLTEQSEIRVKEIHDTADDIRKLQARLDKVQRTMTKLNTLVLHGVGVGEV